MNLNGNKPASNMTKREAFAMAAMQGVLASGATTPKTVHLFAPAVVGIADAVLKELDKPATAAKTQEPAHVDL